MPFFRVCAILILVACDARFARGDEVQPTLENPAPSPSFASYYAGAEAPDIPFMATAPGCQAFAESCGDCCACPLWTVQAGAVILARTSRSAVLVENAVTRDPLLNTRDFGTPWAAGPDISVQRWLDDGSSLQIRFFDVDGWNSRTAFATPPFIVLPTVPPLFGFGLSNMTPTYATRLYSTEFNLQRPASSWLSWLVGFRWVELYENVDLHFSAPLAAGNLRFQTANRLYGGQAGVSALLWNRGALRVDSVLKGGLYGNAASNQFLLTQSFGPTFRAADQSGQVAFLGEIGVVGVYRWTDNMALRAGYQLLWLDGVALAPDQIAATRPITRNGIDTLGDSFYHGALLGIEMAW